MVLLQFSGLLKFVCDPEMGIMRIRGPLKIVASFQGQTPSPCTKQVGRHLSLPSGRPYVPQLVVETIRNITITPFVIRWTIDGI